MTTHSPHCKHEEGCDQGRTHSGPCHVPGLGWREPDCGCEAS